MFNISKAFLDGTFDEGYFRWCYDRAAQGAAKTAIGNENAAAGQYGSQAQQAGGALTPFYRSEMNAQHGFNPEQTGELLGYAGAGTGGAAATGAGQIASEAARTRNTAGVSSALDQNARNRMQQMGTMNLGIGAQDVMGAKQLNQEGAAGMAGLYGTDVNAQLKAMGLIPETIDAETKAGQSGWVQNALGGVNAAAGLIKAFKSGGGGQ